MKKVVRSKLEDTAKMINPTATVVGVVDAMQSKNQKSRVRDGKLLDRLLNLSLQTSELAASTEEKRRNKEQYEKLLKKANPVLWALMISDVEATFGNGKQLSLSRATRPPTSREAVTSIKKREMSSAKDATDTSFEEEFQPIATTPTKPIQQEQFFTPLKQERPKDVENEPENPKALEQRQISEKASTFLPLREDTSNTVKPKEQTVGETEVVEDTKAIQERIPEVVNRESPPTAPEDEMCKLPDNPSRTTDDTVPKHEVQDVSQTVESPKVDAKGLTTYTTLLLEQKFTNTTQKPESRPELSLKKESANSATVKPTAEVPKPKISIFRADSDSESIGPPIQGAIGGQLTSTNDFDDFWD